MDSTQTARRGLFLVLGKIVARGTRMHSRSPSVSFANCGEEEEKLLVSFERLCENYGVLPVDVLLKTDRLPIALSFMHLEDAQGIRILDYGCGSGKTAVYFAQRGAEVVGFDASLSSIRVAVRRAHVNGCRDDARFVVATAEKLPFQDGYFDFVFGHGVLYYVDDRSGYGEEILRVLRPGGKAIFCESIVGNPLIDASRQVLKTLVDCRTRGDPLRLGAIEQQFSMASDLACIRVNMLGMLKRVLGWRTRSARLAVTTLKRLDRRLLRWFPSLKNYCSEVVIVVTR